MATAAMTMTPLAGALGAEVQGVRLETRSMLGWSTTSNG